MATGLENEQRELAEFIRAGLDPRAAVLRQLLRREGRVVRARRGLRGRVPPAAGPRQVDSGSSRAAVPVPRRGDEAVPAGMQQAAAAGVDDRASERRPSADPRADRRVADAGIQRLIYLTRASNSPMSFLDRFKPQPRWQAQPIPRSARRRRRDRRTTTSIARDARGAGRRRTRTCGCGARRRRGWSGGRRPGRWSRAERDEDLRRELTERLVGDRDRAGGRRRRRGAGPRRPRRSEAARGGGEGVAARDGADRGARPRARRQGAQQRRAARRRIAQTALDAVARLADPAELLNVALKTEHKDAGIAALERAVERRRRRRAARHARNGRRRERRTSRSQSGPGR